MRLDPKTVLAIRDECIEVSGLALELFDSLEGGTLTPSGAMAAAVMAGKAEGIRRALAILAAVAMGKAPEALRLGVDG